MTDVPRVTLNDGETIPQVGLGIYGPDDEAASAAVETAIGLGYRLLDTAEQYQNEVGVGVGIKESGIDRQELYVTTKLGNESHGYDATLRGFDGSLGRLGLEYIDLFLIHWPMTKLDLYPESWRALEELKSEGLVKSIGVANFQEDHLRRLFDESGTVPAVNQIELHPGVQRRELRSFNTAHNIVTEAWSPLAYGNLLNHPTLKNVAAHYNKSVAQVLLRWNLDLGNVVIPKTVTPNRMAENLEVFDFTLQPEDVEQIVALENGVRNVYDPDLMDA
ncbi:aldo/keto reductase [Glaciibacter flavus]|uniref:aldo/keto reductase n=1 Tax=Orlajensenia flava TaxID=2565934 RepID=UPI003AFFF525